MQAVCAQIGQGCVYVDLEASPNGHPAQSIAAALGYSSQDAHWKATVASYLLGTPLGPDFGPASEGLFVVAALHACWLVSARVWRFVADEAEKLLSHVFTLMHPAAEKAKRTLGRVPTIVLDGMNVFLTPGRTPQFDLIQDEAKVCVDHRLVRFVLICADGPCRQILLCGLGSCP